MEQITSFIPNWLKEYFKIAARNLRTRRLRSWLTILGVVIGVFLIVSLMSLSEGLKGAVLQQLKMMGRDLVIVMPGESESMFTAMMGGAKLSDADIKAVKKTEGVDVVIPQVYKAEGARFGGEKKMAIIYGVDWKDGSDLYKKDMGWTLASGSWPVAGKSEIIIGNLVPVDIFKGVKVGSQVVIKGRKFEVAGILNSVGSKQDDQMIGLDLNIYREITGDRKGAQMVMAKIKAGYDTEQVAQGIKDNLEESRKRIRGQEEDVSGFTVLSSEKVMNIVGNIMGVIQAVIIGFASIAIVVGGIGIMNTMYTSVRDRVKEIGIMKAIGARNSTVNAIFLIESGFIGLIGGLGGTFLGIVLAKAIEFYFQMHPMFYMRAEVGPGLLLFSLGFSFLVGCLSGFMPARSASKMRPVDALRYE